MNLIEVRKLHSVEPVSARPRSTAADGAEGGTAPARSAALSGAADGAVIGLVIGAVFAVATAWPAALAAIAGGVIVGGGSGAALAHLRPPGPHLTSRGPTRGREAVEARVEK